MKPCNASAVVMDFKTIPGFLLIPLLVTCVRRDRNTEANC
jgi:hypothetical protein